MKDLIAPPIGSFTGTLTGCTTSPSATFYYLIQGNIVYLEVPTLEGTSNSTSATITGVPSEIQVARQQRVACRIKNSGSIAWGFITLESSSAIFTLGATAGSAGFTASGTKGTQFTCVSYPLKLG